MSQRLRALQGPDAPYPHGRDALLAALSTVSAAPLAQAPVSSDSLYHRPSVQTQTLPARG